MNKRILIGILLLANGLATPSFSQETLHHWQSGAIKTPAAAKEETPANKEKEPLLFPTGDFAEMHQTDSPTVDQILDPYRLRLKDKRIVQLSGIEIPDFDINDSGAISIAAQNMLKELLEGKQVTLFQTRDVSQGRVNRLGHMLAHIIVGEEKTWVQGTLVANGMARVQSVSHDPEMAGQLMKLEAEARAAKKGLWADDNYAVLTPDTADRALGKWAIVEGTVHGAASSNNMIYINFGPDWKSDFTIGIDAANRRQISRTGIDPLALAGKSVRVRGWIENYNGPFIRLSSPAWLEILN